MIDLILYKLRVFILIKIKRPIIKWLIKDDSDYFYHLLTIIRGEFDIGYRSGVRDLYKFLIGEHRND